MKNGLSASPPLLSSLQHQYWERAEGDKELTELPLSQAWLGGEEKPASALQAERDRLGNPGAAVGAEVH